jgi:anti-sigma factor ChrR (cupin superfamily)
MRSTHPFELEEVMAYLDGEISADRASEIAQHMQQCGECRELAAGFRNLSHELAAWEIETSPERLTNEMNAEIAAAARMQPKQTPSAPVELTPIERLIAPIRSLRGQPWVWAGAGALAMALVVVAVAVPNFLRARPAAHIAAHEMQLRELQKRMAQQQVASSLEYNQADERYSASVNDKSAVATMPPPPPPGTSASTAPMIARTASLSLVVKDFSAIQAAVKAVVSRHSGYIGELNTSTPPDAAKTFSATLRVPSAQLEPALAELKQLGRADQESQSGEEVTKQYVDLAARLKNSRATEERLLGVLRNNTGKVKDVLEVENEISRVRGEIEGMEADQRALQARIDFATITLSVTEEYKASLNGAPSSTGTRLHNAFVTGYHSVVENMVGLTAWLLESGPTLLLWVALLFFPLRWAWRRLRRTLTSTPKAAAA